MSIQFDCESCGHAVNLDDERAGTLVLCDNCGHRQRVPGPRRRPAPLASPAKLRVPKPGTANPAIPVEPSLTRASNIFVLGTCVLLLITVFLPWISWPDDTPGEVTAKADEYVPGIALPFIMKNAAKDEVAMLSELRDNGFYRAEGIDKRIDALNGNALQLTPAYLLVLLPIIAIWGFIDELYCARRGIRHWPMQLAVLFAPIIGLCVVFMTFDSAVRLSMFLAWKEWTPKAGLFEWMGIGIYLLPLGVIGGLLGMLLSPKPTQDEWKNAQARQRRAG